MVTNGFFKGTPDEALKSKKAARDYFYLGDNLYRRLKYHSGEDLMKAFNYTTGKMETLPKRHTLQNAGKTFTPVQAAAMMNRSRMYINHLYMFGFVPKPQKSYRIGGDKSDTGRYRLSEKDMYELHKYFSSNGRLETKSVYIHKDSLKPLPSRRELTAMMKYETITYVRGADGEFRPLFNAPSEEDWI